MWRIWLAALFWGLNWPAVKILVTGISPWALRSIGLTAGSLLLLATTLASRQSLAVPRRFWRDLAIAGLLAMAGFNVCTVFAQINMPASRAAILTFTMPLWSVLFAWALLGEPIDGLRRVALAVGAAGLGILSFPFWAEIASGRPPLGLIYVMGAAISWALGTVYLKGRRVPVSALTSTTWQMIVSAAATTAGMLLLETPRIELSPPIAAALAYHVVFPQTVAYVLWFSLVSKVAASTAALGTLLVPIFGVIGSIVVLGERPTPVDLAGFGLILLAVLLDQGYRGFRDRRRR